MIKDDIIVGIDPDIIASGVAELHVANDYIHLQTLPYIELLAYLNQLNKQCKERQLKVRVVIEWSASTKHNWHLYGHNSARIASAKGYDIGRNHQIAQDIYDYIKRVLGMTIDQQIPFKKCWKGQDGKITHEEIVSFMPIEDSRTNQEKRDAALLAWLAANKPITIRSDRFPRGQL